ncbi:uncharacterized protein BDV14DRAFT_198474 [Aspergillus stella-maris]|uniref:uncharacterized protein n=1 Tax=Aspergillus stella-maris TaxID=1810926 RepID=UPI003CCD7C08
MAPSMTSPYPSPATQPQPHHLDLTFTHPKSQINVDVIELSSPSDTSDSEPDCDNLDHERARLHRHLGLDSAHPRPYNLNHIQPLFFIERCPDTTIPIKCSLPGCKRSIEPESLRLALNPGMSGESWFRSSSDYYHPSCFELLAPLTTSPQYLSRLLPLTRNTYPLRGLKPSSVSDGTYLLCGGAERLILEWKLRRCIELDQRDGCFDAKRYDLDDDVRDLLYRAGEKGYWPGGRPRGLDVFEYFTLVKTVAVNEAGEFGEGWNLFDEFLHQDGKGEGEREREWGRHDLSTMLEGWEEAVSLAWQDKSTTALETKNALSPTATRAIKRLSTIPVPQVGFH